MQEKNSITNPENFGIKALLVVINIITVSPKKLGKDSKSRKSTEELTKFYFMADCYNDANPLELVPNTYGRKR